jgi:pimeloyl-ACP methyl ester carboxylesterase
LSQTVSSERAVTNTFEVVRDLPGGAMTLRGDLEGDGPPLVLLHGLSATRRNVVQGSRLLVREGYRLVAYDARGHGDSDPPPDPDAYAYADLVEDLDAVLRELGIEHPVLVGSSMGATTAMTWALERPERVPAVVQITPAYSGAGRGEGDDRWREFADALERGGIDAFVEVAEPGNLPERWRETARTATRQRLERHRHLDAIPHALRVVGSSPAFDGLEDLEGFEPPVLVVGSRDEVDRLHPLAVAREYADRLPNAELAVEAEGESPLAWQGAKLSRAIAGFLERNGVQP